MSALMLHISHEKTHHRQLEDEPCNAAEAKNIVRKGQSRRGDPSAHGRLACPPFVFYRPARVKEKNPRIFIWRSVCFPRKRSGPHRGGGAAYAPRLGVSM